MRSRKQYLLVETAISIAINTLLSIGFVFAAFHGRSRIPVAGLHGIIFDMAPQTFMVTLMSFLVPTLLTRRRSAAGALTWHDTRATRTPYNPIISALILALVAMLVVVGLSWFILPLLLPSGSAFPALLAAKAAYGAVLAAFVTTFAINKALR